jgi:hypothetical protein
MKGFISIVIVVLALGVVNTVGAAVWTDLDQYNVKLTAGGSPSYVQSTFNIATLDGNYSGDVAGFVPGVDHVDSAVIEVVAYDDWDFLTGESVTVTLGSVKVGDHLDIGFIFDQLFDITAQAQLIGDINADGILSYKIEATDGDFILSYAQFCATGTHGQDVPEPATIVVWSLLGAGSWLGMRVWRRRETGRRSWSPENRQAIHDIIAGR